MAPSFAPMLSHNVVGWRQAAAVAAPGVESARQRPGPARVGAPLSLVPHLNIYASLIVTLTITRQSCAFPPIRA